MIQARRVGRTKALSHRESVNQGGKTGGTKKRTCSKAGPLSVGSVRQSS